MSVPFKLEIVNVIVYTMDAVKEAMQVVGVRLEDTENRVKWKTMIRCGNP